MLRRREGWYKPPVELVNQIQYDGGDLIDIKSVVYDIEDTDLYTFYLSPTTGITDLAGMTNAHDYLQIVVRNPKGTVNTAADEFEIYYKDITVKQQTMNDVESVKLSTDIVAETSQLNCYVEVLLKTGKTLLVRYNAVCAEAVPVALTNQYELDKSIAAINSVVEWINPENGSTTYYFYTESGIVAPSETTPAAVQFTFAKDVETASIDLSAADQEQVKVACGDFSNATATTGTLSVAKSATTLTVALDGRNSHRLRTNYTGAFVTGYASADHLEVTLGETPAAAALTKMFYFKESSTSHYALGLVEDAAAPEDLMTGDYAVEFSMMTAVNFGTTIDLSTDAGKCPIKIYDYKTYKTYDVVTTEGVTGSITTLGTPEKPYIRLSITIPDGPKVEGEWFGAVTTAAEMFDLTPIEPFTPAIKIVDKDGNVVMNKTLGSMEMRMQKGYKLRGGADYGGATFDAYFFYFRPDTDTAPINDAWSDYSYPIFMIPVSYLNSENLDLTVAQTDLHWNFKFTLNDNKMQYAASGYSETYLSYGSTYGYCPTTAKVTVIQNADKTWKVAFELLDSGVNSYNQKWGYGSTITVEWRGKATKYSGTNTGKYPNDLTDADY